MISKRFKYITGGFAASLLLLLPSCAQTERTEAVTAEIEAAQMEGRRAARIFVNRPWNDDTALHREYSKVKERSEKMAAEGRKEYSAAFDSAFISTVRTVRPDIAQRLNADVNGETVNKKSND